MRVITCTSYYGTCSSAVTDYVTEFETVKSLGEYEIRILHDMDGVTDLQYNLTENHNRHNSGHAIKRFKKLVDFYAGNRLASRYEPFFQNRWREISYKYINSLVDFSYRGWWQYDLLDKGKKYYYYKMVLNKFYKLIIGRNNSHVLNMLPKEITYCGHHLDPSKSIENTQLWKRYDIGSNLKFIEHELAEYLYDYDTVLGGAK